MHRKSLAGIGARQRLGTALQQRRPRQTRLRHHARARVDADQRPLRAAQLERLACEQAGAGADIEHLHALGQTGAAQRLAAIPRAGAPGQQPLHPLVVGSRGIEHVAHEALVLVLVAVVLRQRRVGRQARRPRPLRCDAVGSHPRIMAIARWLPSQRPVVRCAPCPPASCQPRRRRCPQWPSQRLRRACTTRRRSAGRIWARGCVRASG